MFIWSISDIITVTGLIFVLIILGFGFLSMYLEEKKLKNKK